MFVAGSCAGSCQKANAALYNRCEKGRAMTLKSLRLKITWLLLVATLIPLITATIYSHYIASLTIYEKISLTTMSTLKTVSQGVDSELMRLTAEMESATSSREFQKTVNEIRLAQTDGEKWVALRKMDKLMIGIFGKTYAVNGVYLTLPNGESYAVQDKYRLNLKELSKQPWFQDTDSNFGALASCGLVELQEGKSALMFGKPLRDVVDVGNLSVIGSIHFAIDPVLLSALSVKDEDGSSSFLLNSSGQMVAQSVSRATDPEGAVRLIEENWGMLEQDDSGSATVTLGTQQMMLLFDTSPMYRYHYVRLIPLSLYTSELSGISSATFLFALVCVVAVVLVSVAVSNHISKPVNELNRAMRYTEKGNFDIQLQSHRKDEIGQIIQCFNKMVRRLHSFFDQTIADEKEKKRLEIESLQYQISPHFLYNLLASVRSLALVEDAPETAKMLGSVSKLLKTTVGSAGTMIPLQQELENLQRLLYIQNICHNGTVKWCFHVDSTLEGLLVPNLILQPIVENAVFYGANPATGLVTICLEARIENENLLITIRDNGAGIPEEKLETVLLTGTQHGQFSHVGLCNTNERIRMNFGQQYGLSVDSDCEGTAVRVLLPQMLSDEGARV